MNRIELPYVQMPKEFVTLLKSNLSVVNTPEPIFSVIQNNKALYMSLDNAFEEFNDGRGLEKLMLALGWPNFRDRMASVFVYKAIYGKYPRKTNMELVDEIKTIETKYSDHAVHSFSRLFLLGFYLKLAQIKIRTRDNNRFLEIKLPSEIGTVLELSKARTEKIDWLILLITHLQIAFGPKTLATQIANGKKFEDLYESMPIEHRQVMNQNFLAYAASINESEIFLYDKV